MIKDNGGPAFPVAYGEGRIEGMTLRDYFAAKAMQGLAANPRWNVTRQIETCASEAYAIADAMIAEGKKQ